MQTSTGHAVRLASALTDMVLRYGEASRKGAYAYDNLLDGHGDRAEVDRWERVARRRFRAVQRLTAALRDLPLKEEK